MQALAGDNDPQTCRCQLNLAEVYLHFLKNEEAKALYEAFLSIYNSQDGSGTTQDWSQIEAFKKL